MTASSRTLPHVGEWKVELRASTVEELFSELAHTLADACGRASTAPASAWERIELEARDCATLLIDWANELIGRSEAEGRSYREIRRLAVTEHRDSVEVTADVRGVPVRDCVSPVKAATYHDVSVGRKGNGWEAVVLLDV